MFPFFALPKSKKKFPSLHASMERRGKVPPSVREMSEAMFH